MIVVGGQRIAETDPFAELFAREQTDCGKILETLTASGVSYRPRKLRRGAHLHRSARQFPAPGNYVAIAPSWFSGWRGEARGGIHAALAVYGFDFSKAAPAARQQSSVLSGYCWRWGCFRR